MERPFKRRHRVAGNHHTSLADQHRLHPGPQRRRHDRQLGGNILVHSLHRLHPAQTRPRRTTPSATVVAGPVRNGDQYRIAGLSAAGVCVLVLPGLPESWPGGF